MPRITHILVQLGMARSGGEATQLVKSGAISVGHCQVDCGLRQPPWTKCRCPGWTKIQDPFAQVAVAQHLRTAGGGWRLTKREGVAGWDQVPGSGTIPCERDGAGRGHGDGDGPQHKDGPRPLIIPQFPAQAPR